MEVLAEAVDELDTFLDYVESKRPPLEDAERLSVRLLSQGRDPLPTYCSPDPLACLHTI